MKLCLTVNSSPWSRFKGGGQIAVHHLASALARLGHEVHVIYSKTAAEAIQPQTAYRVHWAAHFNCATINLNIFSFARKLAELAARERFDIVHGNAEEAYFFAPLARRHGARFCFTSHAPFIPATGIWQAALRRPVFLLKNLNFHLLRAAADAASRIFVFSQFSRGLVLAGLGPGAAAKTAVIPPGVDPSWFEVEREPAPPPGFLFWGRVENEKGIPELLRAFAGLAVRHPQINLHLAGEGNNVDFFRQMAHNLNIGARVHFHGWLQVPEIQRLAARCRFGVFPSRVESFGLAVAEAAAAGLPVIAGAAGALPEILEDGRTGILTPPGNMEKLQDAMAAALALPEERLREMSARARESVRQRFSWDAAAGLLAEHYKSLTNRA